MNGHESRQQAATRGMLVINNLPVMLRCISHNARDRLPATLTGRRRERGAEFHVHSFFVIAHAGLRSPDPQHQSEGLGSGELIT